MKTKYLTILLVFLSLSLQSAFAKNEGKPDIEFEKTTHDFGTIKESDGPVSYRFVFRNTGDAPLIILSASATCGCTRPKYPKKPIKPGEAEEIKVTYIPLNRPGEFNKEVKIKTNVPKKKRVKLRIAGTVIPQGK